MLLLLLLLLLLLFVTGCYFVNGRTAISVLFVNGTWRQLFIFLSIALSPSKFGQLRQVGQAAPLSHRTLGLKSQI